MSETADSPALLQDPALSSPGDSLDAVQERRHDRDARAEKTRVDGLMASLGRRTTERDEARAEAAQARADIQSLTDELNAVTRQAMGYDELPSEPRAPQAPAEPATGQPEATGDEDDADEDDDEAGEAAQGPSRTPEQVLQDFRTATGIELTSQDLHFLRQRHAVDPNNPSRDRSPDSADSIDSLKSQLNVAFRQHLNNGGSGE